jgi:hypothetical protein
MNPPLLLRIAHLHAVYLLPYQGDTDRV